MIWTKEARLAQLPASIALLQGLLDQYADKIDELPARIYFDHTRYTGEQARQNLKNNIKHNQALIEQLRAELGITDETISVSN